MNKFVYFVLAFFIVISSSCMRRDNDQEGKTKGKYIIPDSLYSFFPEKDFVFNKKRVKIKTNNAEKTNLPYYKYEFAITFYVKVYQYTDKSYFFETKKSYVNQSINKFESAENNYFVIGSERDLFSRYDTLELKKKYLNLNKIDLVLDFHGILKDHSDFYNQNTICGLPKNYEILKLISGDEFVLPKKYKNSWEVLPDKFKHGYLGGVAYNESEYSMIFWVAAW